MVPRHHSNLVTQSPGAVLSSGLVSIPWPPLVLGLLVPPSGGAPAGAAGSGKDPQVMPQTPAPTPEQTPPPAAVRCDGAAAAQALGLARQDWHVACLEVEGKKRVIAAVPMTPLGPPPTGKTRAPRAALAAPPLVLWVALSDGAGIIAWKDRLTFDRKAPGELREMLLKSEEWVVGIDDQALGADRGVRVGVVGHWGESTMSVREIALLFRVPAQGSGPLKLVWQGLGNTRESRFDYCQLDGIATFKLLDERTVERQVSMTPIINRDAPVSEKLAGSLEKKCVAKPQPARRFPVVP